MYRHKSVLVCSKKILQIQVETATPARKSYKTNDCVYNILRSINFATIVLVLVFDVFNLF